MLGGGSQAPLWRKEAVNNILGPFDVLRTVKGESHTAMMRRLTTRPPIAIDLFCGAGGLSQGLRMSGFRPALGIDIDRHAISTFATNHPETVTLCQDISSLRARDIFDAAGTDDVALVAGGPSCQGFSTHGKRIEDDPRNFLFQQFVRVVREVRPRFFMMENVKGLLVYRKGHFRTTIEDAFRRIGYNVVSTTLCAADYGVPQLRHRVFFLGTRLDVPLSFPQPTHGSAESLFSPRPHVTVEEAISDLPLMHGEFRRSEWHYASEPSSPFQVYARSGTGDIVSLHQANGLSEQAREIAKHVQQGQGLRSVPVSDLPARFRRMRTISNGELRKDCTTLYHRLSPSMPAYTITCYYRNVASGPFLHPYEDRSLSHREAARFMSFPDCYQFAGASVPRQIGNAVPPLLARAVGLQILRLLGYKVPSVEDERELATA